MAAGSSSTAYLPMIHLIFPKDTVILITSCLERKKEVKKQLENGLTAETPEEGTDLEKLNGTRFS